MLNINIFTTDKLAKHGIKAKSTVRSLHYLDVFTLKIENYFPIITLHNVC